MVSQKIFDTSTQDNGSLYVRIMHELKNSDPNFIKWPDYLFPEGICTNGLLATSIKPFTEFKCKSRDIKLKMLFHYFGRNIEKTAKTFWQY